MQNLTESSGKQRKLQQSKTRHLKSQFCSRVSSDAPEEFHYVSTSNNVPLATTFKPAMKVLSRKPAPRMIAKRDPVTGLEQLTIEDDKDDDDEAKKNQLTPEEIRMRQQKELEEKQRRYEEARAKIFGESATSSGNSTPGNVTPPQNERRPNQRGKGRGRGGHRNDSHSRHDSQTRRPANPQATSSPRELYDPDCSPKPGFSLQKRGGGNGSPARPSTPRDEDQIIRGPRGPDSSGRGGFGFARRGAKEG